MKIVQSKDYIRSIKRIKKKRTLSLDLIDETLALYLSDQHDARLQFKPITCKRDKHRHSLRIPGTQYRILISILDDTTTLVCVCDHDDYDRRNKNC